MKRMKETAQMKQERGKKYNKSDFSARYRQ